MSRKRSSLASLPPGVVRFEFSTAKIKDKKLRSLVDKLQTVAKSQQSTIVRMKQANDILKRQVQNIRAENLQLKADASLAAATPTVASGGDEVSGSVGDEQKTHDTKSTKTESIETESIETETESKELSLDDSMPHQSSQSLTDLTQIDAEARRRARSSKHSTAVSDDSELPRQLSDSSELPRLFSEDDATRSIGFSLTGESRSLKSTLGFGGLSKAKSAAVLKRKGGSEAEAGTTGYSYDEAFSSGEDIDVYETLVEDTRELMPIKQGFLHKKSEKVKAYNKRWCVLYRSFLLYYKNEVKLTTSRFKKTHKNEVNHPQGCIFLLNYHLFVRNDPKKYLMTLVPNTSSVQMGYAHKDIKIRFRCKTETALKDWVTAIRTAIDASRFGLIQLQVKEDVIFSEVGGRDLATDSSKRKTATEGESTVKATASRLTAAQKPTDDGTAKKPSETSRSKQDSDSESKHSSDEAETEELTRTRVFTEKELLQLIDEKKRLLEKITVFEQRNMALISEKKDIEERLEEKDFEIESGKRIFDTTEANLKANLNANQQKLQQLTHDLHELRTEMSEMEGSLRAATRKCEEMEEKRHDAMRYVAIIGEWHKKIYDRCSLERLAQLYPRLSNDRLFDHCQRACIDLLMEAEEFAAKTHAQPLVNELISNWMDLMKNYLKLMSQNASLLKEHDSVKGEMVELKKFIEEEYETDSSADPSGGLILASHAAVPF